jgi:ferrochelatase
LKEFLSLRGVIEVNPIIWQVFLNLFILTFRPSKTAKAYKEIWMKEKNMSPLRYYTEMQTMKLSKIINNENIIVDYAMRYGNPSINSRIRVLHEKGCENLMVLPLYPQYAAATTATVCDEVYRTLMKMRWQPNLKIVPHYESEPLYISALKNSLENKISNIDWKPDLIVASYHGIPKKYFEKGDPYHCYCHKTTRLISESFNKIPIQTTFQSRFGPQEWLQPYTDKTLENLPKEGKKNVLVVCPGFSSDCVETLEEISIQGKESFLKSGGNNFDLVPCLNDNEDHIKLIKHLVTKNF